MLLFVFFKVNFPKQRRLLSHVLWQGHAHALRCVQRKLKERRKERKIIYTSYLRNAVIKETELRMEPYGVKLLGTTALDWMKWSSKPTTATPPPPLPQMKDEAMRKTKTQTRHINFLDMGEGMGSKFSTYFVQGCGSKKAWRRLRQMENSLSNSSYKHVNVLKTIYKGLRSGDSWILNSLSLTCKIKVDASVLFKCYKFHSVIEN